MSTTFVQLGKTGDILTLLPLLWAEAQKGEKPSLVVSRRYAHVLDYVSYVEPVVLDGEAHEIDRGYSLAMSLGKPVVCTQVNGPKELVQEYVYKPAGLEGAVSSCFEKEQWRLAGRLSDWGMAKDHPFGCYPLVIDKRKPEAEALISKLLPKTPFALIHTKGEASPFPYEKLLRELLRYSKLKLVPIEPVDGATLIDWLPAFEKAKCFIGVDTASLHLANAVPSLPVFAMVNDKPSLWNGTAYRGQHVWYCRYRDFPDRAHEFLDAIKEVKAHKVEQKIVSVWNAGADEPSVCESGWVPLPVKRGMAPFLGPVEDPKYPRVRDLVKMGLSRSSHQGWIVLSRPNIAAINPTLTEHIMMDGPCYAYRIDQAGNFVPVVDLFSAPAAWWREKLGLIPDLYVSNDWYWSQALWTIFRADKAADITGMVQRNAQARAAKPAQQLSPSQRVNESGASALTQGMKIYSRYPKVSEQLPTVTVNSAKLFPGGYNPSIVGTSVGVIMAYRFHPHANPSTKLAVAHLDPTTGEAVNNYPLDVPGAMHGSSEDPRLVRGGNGSVLLTFVDSQWPYAAKSQVRQTVLKVAEQKAMGTITPPIGKNGGEALEKNWIYWFDQGEAFCMYATSPEQIVYAATSVYKTPGPKWPYGDPRGGTPPVLYKGKWLRFFHSRRDNEAFGNYRHRYFMGAYLMETAAPFAVVAVSHKPILIGSEIDDMKVKDRPHHWKPNVVFPAGIVELNEGWLVSVGVNDSQCALVTVKPENLNL